MLTQINAHFGVDIHNPHHFGCASGSMDAGPNWLVSLLGLGVRVSRTLFFAPKSRTISNVIDPYKYFCNAP